MRYHALNRGNAGQKVFRKIDDYAYFLELLIEASERWQRTTARRLGLESSLRSRGRPRKK
ncbi:MAG: hypothetical protein IH831_11470 [Planctomycetes bacterium]|nr:hypothetical protein [Planctomycetota bacterium]